MPKSLRGQPALRSLRTQLPRDGVLLSRLPTLEDADVHGARRRDLLRATRRLVTAWEFIVQETSAFEDEVELQESFESELELRAALLLKVVANYGQLVAEVARQTNGKGLTKVPGLSREAIRDRRAFGLALDDRDIDWLSEVSTIVAYGFLTAAISASLRIPSSSALSSPHHSVIHLELFGTASRLDAEVPHLVRTLISRLADAHGEGRGEWQRALLEVSLHKILTWQGQLFDLVYKDTRRSFRSANWSPPPGPFTALRIEQLPGLAARSEAVIELYGARQVERVFEAQLNLTVQSLGFMVIAARTGQRRVDLVCLSVGAGSPTTFLIEAKSSRRPYSLPTDDERALGEYVRDVRRSLTTLPPLKFVLLIGDEPARTLPGKLRRLGADLGIPIRFMRARNLTGLRAGLAGPVRVDTFTDHVLASNEILEESFVNKVIEAESRLHRAHTELVDVMLSRRLDDNYA